MQDNPYADPPELSQLEPQSVDPEQVQREYLRQKCLKLLEHREKRASVWTYAAQDWKRQTILLLIYLGLFAVLVGLNVFPILNALLIGFYIGRTVRDFTWWRALAREWPSSRELLDWPKIERIATPGSTARE